MIQLFTSAKKWNQREKHDVLAEFFGACQGAQIQHDILHITDGLLKPFGPFALRNGRYGVKNTGPDCECLIQALFALAVCWI